MLSPRSMLAAILFACAWTLCTARPPLPPHLWARQAGTPAPAAAPPSELFRSARQAKSDSYRTNGCGVDGDNEEYGKYHHQDDMEKLLDRLVSKYPSLAYKYQLSELTVQQNPLLVLRVGPHAYSRLADGTLVPPPGVPQIKYVANMHGDEVVGRENCLRFVDALLRCYDAGDDEVIAFLSSVDLHVMPSMNPDGFELGQRSNGNHADLNRDFPDQYDYAPYALAGSRSMASALADYAGRQPETVAVMKWLSANRFVLSINYHGGAVVANYPYDGDAAHSYGMHYAGSPDDALFRQLAHAYASENPDMTSSHQFANGITNGAYWYSLYGGMQDFNYIWHGCLELTVELSNTKWPASSSLSSYWLKNRNSMLSYLQLVNTGVRGRISNRDGQPIGSANVTIVGDSMIPSDPALQRPVYPHPVTGWYFRLLTAGVHMLRVTAAGCPAAWRTVVVAANSPALIENFVLDC